MDWLFEEFEKIVGKNGVLTGDDVLARNAGVWRSDPVGAKAIVRPKTTEQVSAILKICFDADQRVVAHGGLTNLVQGADSTDRDIVLSLELMNKVEEVDTLGRTITAQSGAVLQTLQEAAQKSGLMLPLDLGARGSCTIGGNLSTNAGGNKVLRYGSTRALVLGLEAVLANGTVITSLNSMIKNNAGYDIKQLFIGSEGTLGIITRVVMRLWEKPKSQDLAIVAVQEFDKLIELLRFCDSELSGSMSAFEVMWNDFYKVVTTKPAQHKPPLPQSYPYYAIIESMGSNPEKDRDRFQTMMEQALQNKIIVDAAITKSTAEQADIWAIRDDVEQLNRFKPIFTFDISLPHKHMATYVTNIQKELKDNWPDCHSFIFGHLGDTNLHIVIAPGESDPETQLQVENIIYQPLKSINGSISAEHGIGLEKKAYLAWCRDDAEITLMRSLKKMLDPKNILNPGKIFDLVGR